MHWSSLDRNRVISRATKCELRPDGRRTSFQVVRELGRGGNGVAFLVKSNSKTLVAKLYIPPDSRDLDDNAIERFRREVELTARVRHPFVVSSEGNGLLHVGSYQLPFYMMPKAEETLRERIPERFDRRNLLSNLRLIMRTLLGLSYLHHHGIIHRDLKPENILIFQRDAPRIADLGIAHVMPGFVEWSQITVKEERLMNWDYYAPEQRFGDATRVDHRADIYAMGCILYELVTGVQPVRPTTPRPSEVDSSLGPLDAVFLRMTHHEPAKRYPHVESVLEEIMVAMTELDFRNALGGTLEDQKGLLAKLIRNNNPATQAQAIEVAKRLGSDALPVLHEQLGHSKVNTAAAAYAVAGIVQSRDSLPYLVAGLYARRNARRPTFPTGQAAAKALAKYPVEVRLESLSTISDLVKPEDIDLVVQGVPPDAAFPQVRRLHEAGLLSSDFYRTDLKLLLQVKEGDGWGFLRDAIVKKDRIYSWDLVENLLEPLSAEHQIEAVRLYLERKEPASAWEMDSMLTALEKARIETSSKVAILKLLGTDLRITPHARTEIGRMRDRFDKLERNLESDTPKKRKGGDS